MKYSDLVEVYEELESTSKRLEKTRIIAKFLRTVKVGDLEQVCLLLQGKVFQQYDEAKLGVAARLVLKALATASGESVGVIEKKWKSLGDLGDVGKDILGKKKQATLFSAELTVQKVFDNLTKLSGLVGSGTVGKKVGYVSELLTSAKAAEAKYIVRIVLEELRVGVADGTLRDAIVWAFFGKEIDVDLVGEVEIGNREEYVKYNTLVQEAFDVSNNWGAVAKIAKEKGATGLARVSIKVFIPIKVMLGPKEEDAKSALERVGSPCQAEFKYDGFRIEVHKESDKVELYTRRLEKVTKQFPEVVQYILDHVKGKSFILDCEAVGFDGKSGEYLPFQHISQRIRRKYDIEDLARKLPVELNVFDILFFEGKNMIGEEFGERRKLLEKIVKPVKKKIRPAEGKIVKNEKEVSELYANSLAAGNEGLMLKKLDAPYKPGARVGYMVKLKHAMETFDVVVVGAEWGEGKRAKWLSSFTIAVRKGEEFLGVGKVGTGIKEKAEEGLSFGDMTKLLRPLVVGEEGKTVVVKPKIVLEISFEEIQKSTNYDSGYALRFPRVVRLRDDKGVDEITSLKMVEGAFEGQRK
jgi:DNA ligase-1